MQLSDLKPGYLTSREEMKNLFGGGTMSGIETPTTSPNILLYSDEETGRRYGYKDGWLAEEDDRGPVFEYTGHGRKGHQTFGNNGRGNRAVRDHATNGKTLRLFVADGTAPNSSAKRQRYIGAFTLDEDEPYTIRQGPDEDDNPRNVIVFRLRPIDDQYQHQHKDDIPTASESTAVPVPATSTSATLVDTENNQSKGGTTSGSAGGTFERREAQLSDDYKTFLEAEGHTVKRFKQKIKGLSAPLLTDLYDATAHVLYEAKGSTSRADVRMAIGQLYDYRRLVEPPNPTLAVL
ncbi:hypothetical protein, partial [Streptomyces cacaoi]|uniref:hypothetical protein n=1 Tax=Streptomyces cacaoi TaxID=1898 RepID=UPI003749E4AB